MKTNLLTLFIITAALLIPAGIAQAEAVYKWTDAAGQVHYGQQKPEDATPAETVNIAAPPPASPSSDADSAAEIARINALSEQMARDRQAAEQARQQQAIRNLEQENQQLQNELLKKQQQQQQQQDDNNDTITVGPSPYYPYPYPPERPYPPGPPCQPWPDCHQHRPAPPPEPSRPLAKPNPVFRPAPVGVSRDAPGGFTGR